MPKLKTAAEDVPALVTVAGEPGDRVVVVPAAIVAAAPFVPFVPFVPLLPAGPGVPSSIVRVAGAEAKTPASNVPIISIVKDIG
jgi:hypothetical protein